MPSGDSRTDRGLNLEEPAAPAVPEERGGGLNVTLVVAADRDDGIGYNGGLPWRLPSDLKFFRRVTTGHPVIMGRKTFESIGKPLPERTNIVVSRNTALNLPAGTRQASSLVAALAMAVHAPGGDEIMVIGGAELFRQAMGQARRIYLTRLHESFPADTYLPPIDWRDWRRVWREEHTPGRNDACGYTFMCLERAAPPPTA